MRWTRQIMGMPVTIAVAGSAVTEADIEPIFDFFRYVDDMYSPYKETSIVTQINRGNIPESQYPEQLQHILRLAELTKRETNGYFDVWYKGVFDPSGLVKGWAISEAAKRLATTTDNFYVEAGGDIQTNGVNQNGEPWHIGIRNPFDRHQHIAVLSLSGGAVATSGTAIRGNHIYNPVNEVLDTTIVSLSVVAPNIFDADRYATAAFAMGERGMYVIEQTQGYEAYAVTSDGKAIMTTGWQQYEVTA